MNRIYYLLIVLITASVALVSFSVPAEQGGKLSVVINPNGPPEQLSATDLKKIFKGEVQRWKNGTKVVVVMMKTSTPTGNETAGRLFNMSGNDLNKYWLSLVFAGKAHAPYFISSESELLQFVSQNPGAIGIIDTKDAHNGKIALVDGNESF
jgi:ABC-type phosphate transport system substrate-binding protein